ncbi:MAG: hypothetical protein K5765_04240 [Clostridia bacterium]|nr:hypothetical protein [Clostridia bacterium]
MAQEKKNSILKKLVILQEDRFDEQISEERQGRFRYFREVSKESSSSLFLTNLLFLIFLLPLLAVYFIPIGFGGVENLAYKIAGISNSPYLLSNFGFGISNYSATILDVKMQMLNVYYFIFLAIGVSMIPMFIGFGGIMHLATKFVLKDKFIKYKKDNYGNDIPKVIGEYFYGIKKHILPMLLVGFLFMILFAGIGNVFVYFVGNVYCQTLNVGHYFMIIFASIFSLLFLMVMLNFIPSIFLYKGKMIDKFKNSVIFTIKFPIQTLFFLIIFVALFVGLIFANNIIGIIIVAVLMVFGSKYYSLIMATYAQYLSEIFMIPNIIKMQKKGINLNQNNNNKIKKLDINVNSNNDNEDLNKNNSNINDNVTRNNSNNKNSNNYYNKKINKNRKK